MMKLSTLWSIDRTIDADGSSPVARRIADRWQHDQGSVRFIRSSANFLYEVRREGAPCFLRFAASSERRREVIEAEMALLQWLAREGLPVVRPIPSRDGLFVDSVAMNGATFHAVLFEGLSGAQFEIDDLDSGRFQLWGAALGRLHAMLERYPRPVALDRESLRDRLRRARRSIPNDAPALQAESNELEAVLSALPVNRDTFGLIHGDFEPDNLVWQDRTAQMLDFDDCLQGWFAADIAFALRDRFDAGAEPDDADIRAFLSGYAIYASLPQDVLDPLPVFSRLARLLQYAKLARALDLEPEPGQPDWLLDVISRLRARMEVYRTSLERG
jgi:Ser/Thr protein kinase RdoA (MazF antagonist)